jgi:hypothetical protein
VAVNQSGGREREPGEADAERYRVLPDEEGWLFVPVEPVLAGESYRPVAVPTRGHGLDGAVADLRPGYLVRARLGWERERPRVEWLAVEDRTLFSFREGVTPTFEAASALWARVEADGEAMGSRVTYSTDGQANGALYAFADPPGADRLAEFRDGRRPLEPLLERVDEVDPDGSLAEPPAEPGVAPDGSLVVPAPDAETDAGADPGDGDGHPGHELPPGREVFVLAPAGEAFALVYVVLRKGGTLADTLRETYGPPRPEEPWADREGPVVADPE